MRCGKVRQALQYHISNKILSPERLLIIKQFYVSKRYDNVLYSNKSQV